MPWVVRQHTEEKIERHEFARDEWIEAAEKYRSLVWEWAETQDEFAATMDPDREDEGWLEILEHNRFGEGMEIGSTASKSMSTFDGYGGTARFSLRWEDE